ncbi:MAG: acetoacetate decarboxylase [Nocardioidaceae bacterium]|nr:acetoacetate decarboxylase [Nocardioidaceae bacterium]NUS51021.1 acetoacetate decarboxylase [Nocardioidaceae bacterium]
MPFPSPPWRLQAEAWLSLFALRDTGREDRPGGVYAAAFVDYGEAGVLGYHELLVARLVREGAVPRVRITDIWVDSRESREGGRSLWAIPKELADLPLRSSGWGVATRTSFSGVAEGHHLATGGFTAVPNAALVRTPFVAATSQPREDGSVVVTRFSGSSRALPCHGRWRFGPDGPLGFLHGRRPLASFHLRDARLTFG